MKYFMVPYTSRPFLSLNHRSFSLPLPSTVLLNPKNFITMSFSSSSLSPPTNTEEQKLLLTQILKYHNTTKHSFNNYAKGPRGLDWANQPNPFRRFDSAPLVPLDRDVSVSSLFYSSVFVSLPDPKPLSSSSISQFFYDSLALSAWKTAGFSTWPLRVNPSSGNLHPTEAYIIAPAIDSLWNSPFVAHYAPKAHGLEVRAEIPSGFFKVFPENSFLVGLSSIFWREAWKYGERAYRYCNHDVGHAIAAVAIAAANLGWDVKVLDGLGTKDLERLMGLDIYKGFHIPSRPVKGKFLDIESEHPDCVLAVFPNGTFSEFDVNYEDLSNEIAKFSNLEWRGKPNTLSKEQVCWDAIYRTAEAAKKPLANQNRVSNDPFRSSKLISDTSYKKLTVSEVVRKRRSAVDMDGIHVMERGTFYQILLHCMPSGSCEHGEKQGRQTALAFRVLSWDAEVHAVLFVHRVVGLPKGLYFLVRNEDHFDELKKGMDSGFKWRKPEGCPDDLPLYELARGDCQTIAKKVSCHQDIAGDGCFSLGMVARFEPTLRKDVWMYPRLFWETGVLGQILYLEAHAIDISATGIGCYFDDAVHEILGLTGSDFQSLYHFTVGAPVVDKRIMSLPAYPGPGVDA